MVFSVVGDPMAGFLYALRSPISKKKYPQRVLRCLGFNCVNALEEIIAVR